MNLEDFKELVADALDNLSEELQYLLDRNNVVVVVEDWPTAEQMAENGLESRHELLGLYEGIDLTRRGGDYNMALPDKITIFQGPLEAMCATREELAAEVEKTVKHEIDHHFGLSHERQEELGLE